MGLSCPLMGTHDPHTTARAAVIMTAAVVALVLLAALAVFQGLLVAGLPLGPVRVGRPARGAADRPPRSAAPSRSRSTRSSPSSSCRRPADLAAAGPLRRGGDLGADRLLRPRDRDERDLPEPAGATDHDSGRRAPGRLLPGPGAELATGVALTSGARRAAARSRRTVAVMAARGHGTAARWAAVGALVAVLLALPAVIGALPASDADVSAADLRPRASPPSPWASPATPSRPATWRCRSPTSSARSPTCSATGRRCASGGGARPTTGSTSSPPAGETGTHRDAGRHLDVGVREARPRPAAPPTRWTLPAPPDLLPHVARPPAAVGGGRRRAVPDRRPPGGRPRRPRACG